MRERLGVYAALALLGAPLGYWWARPFDLSPLNVAHPTPESLLPIVYEFLRDLVPFLFLSVVARFFIVSSTMRRLDPKYKTTPRRFAVQVLVTLLLIVFSFVSFYGSALPGALGAFATFALLAVSIGAILLSQALFAALVDQRRPGSEGAPIGDAVKLSYLLTRESFFATLIVTLIGIVFVVFPVNLAILPLFLATLLRSPSWLALGTPILVLMFVYFECVRFTLMGRWYDRLSRAGAKA